MAVQNDYMTVAYRLYVRDEGDDEEALVEECSKDEPFRFITHLGCVLPTFEEAMEPLQTGDEFDIVIPHDKAYGEVDDARIFDVPKDVFTVNGKFDAEHIFEGNIIPLQDEDGQQFSATVIEVKEDAVTIDLNHPRAGQDLHFQGTVVEKRPATADEITGMVNMMANDTCGCGCGCDCDDCDDHHHHHHGDGCGCGHCH